MGYQWPAETQVGKWSNSARLVGTGRATCTSRQGPEKGSGSHSPKVVVPAIELRNRDFSGRSHGLGL